MEHCQECGNTADHLLGCERAKCPVAAYHAKLSGQRSDDKKERQVDTAVAAPSHVVPINEEAYIRSILSVVQHDMREAVRRDLEALLDAVRATPSSSGASEVEAWQAMQECDYCRRAGPFSSCHHYVEFVKAARSAREDT